MKCIVPMKYYFFSKICLFIERQSDRERVRVHERMREKEHNGEMFHWLLHSPNDFSGPRGGPG